MTAPKYKALDKSTGEDVEKSSIQESSGPADANKIISTNAQGLIDSSLLKEARQLIHTVEINGGKDVHHGQLVKFSFNDGSHSPALLSNGDKQRIFTDGAQPDLIHNTLALSSTSSIHLTNLGFVPLESDYSFALDFHSDDMTNGAIIASSYDTNGYGWQLYLDPTGKPAVTGTTDVSMGVNVGPLSLLDDSWNKVVFNYTASTRTIDVYVNDGIFISFAITGTTFDAASSNFVINGIDLQDGNGIVGGATFNICMLSFWYKTLTVAERTFHYNGGKGLSYDDFNVSLGTGLEASWDLHNGGAVNQYFTDRETPVNALSLLNVDNINAGEFLTGDELIGVYTGIETITHGVDQELDAVSEGFAKISLPDFANMNYGDALTFDNQGYMRLRVPGEDRPIIGVFHGPADPNVATINWVRIIKPTFPDIKMYEIPVTGPLSVATDSILAVKRTAGGDYVWMGKEVNLIRVWAKLGTASGSNTLMDTTTTKSRLNTGDSTIFTEYLIPSSTNDEYGAAQETLNTTNGNDGRLGHGDKIFFELLPGSAFTGRDVCIKFEIEDVRF